MKLTVEMLKSKKELSEEEKEGIHEELEKFFNGIKDNENFTNKEFDLFDDGREWFTDEQYDFLAGIGFAVACMIKGICTQEAWNYWLKEYNQKEE